MGSPITSEDDSVAADAAETDDGRHVIQQIGAAGRERGEFLVVAELIGMAGAIQQAAGEVAFAVVECVTVAC